MKDKFDKFDEEVLDSLIRVRNSDEFKNMSHEQLLEFVENLQKEVRRFRASQLMKLVKDCEEYTPAYTRLVIFRQTLIHLRKHFGVEKDSS